MLGAYAVLTPVAGCLDVVYCMYIHMYSTCMYVVYICMYILRMIRTYGYNPLVGFILFLSVPGSYGCGYWLVCVIKFIKIRIIM